MVVHSQRPRWKSRGVLISCGDVNGACQCTIMNRPGHLRRAVQGSVSRLVEASEHVVPSTARCARVRSSGASDCVVEVTDLPRAVPGDANDSAWMSKAKMLLQQSFKHFGPVLEVRFPTAVASVRFASSRGPEAVMVAAPRGFLPLGEGEVRVRLPGCPEAVWQKFPPLRRQFEEKATAVIAETKKKKLRPNERFAPQALGSAGTSGQPVDESERFWDEQCARRQREAAGGVPLPPLPPGPAAASGPESGPEATPAPARAEPPKPVPLTALPEVALALAGLLEKPFSQQRRALKAIQRQWHPDKHPGEQEVATRVFQFIQAHDSWLAFHGLV